jgi:hypothetical protein
MGKGDQGGRTRKMRNSGHRSCCCWLLSFLSIPFDSEILLMMLNLMAGSTPSRSWDVIDGESNRQRSFSNVESHSCSRIDDWGSDSSGLSMQTTY